MTLPPPHNNSGVIIWSADNTSIIGFIKGGDESTSRDRDSQVTDDKGHNEIVLDIDKTRELIVDYR